MSRWSRRRVSLTSGAILVAAVAALVFVRSRSEDGDYNIDFSGPVAGWPHYGSDPGGQRHSPLTQVTRQNVSHLTVAWTYRSGDVSDGSEYPSRSSFQATPILFRDRLYFPTPFNRVIALDPESGREQWTFDPGIDLGIRYSENLVARGVASWSGAEGGPCAHRILFGTLDARLLALDADTGVPCAGFGDNGEVDLKDGIGRVDPGQYEVTSPPVIVGDVVVVGSGIGDNRRVDVERGTVRGFDVRTGELRWAWDPVPRSPDDPGWAEWSAEGAAITGAGNAWAPLSSDPGRGLVFVPTGSAAPDFFGGVRPGSDIYANSVVALNAATGERVWHFQVVHHDLWDYDVASQPSLATVIAPDGRSVPAVIQPTKMGFIFVLHRETGVPVFPVEERVVPRSGVAGEQTSATQPFPTHPPPLHPLELDPQDAFGITPWDRGRCSDMLRGLRYEGIFTPPSEQGTLQYPSMIGGANWGGAAIDEVRGIMVINLNRFASWVRLIPRERFDEVARTPGFGGQIGPQEGTPYVMTREPIATSPWGMPCTRPPWGVLVAVDLASGEQLWEVPHGTIRDLAPVPLPLRWGGPTLGGPVITASGLVFIGASMDAYLRAYDLETGEELWKGRLPTIAFATPMTYRLSEEGRQYVVIAAGGHGGAPAPVGDELIAFALPDPGSRE